MLGSDLARRMARQRERQLAPGDSAAVVAYPDELRPSRQDIDLYLAGARIETVLDEFFHHRRRALDDLAGGDLVDQVTG